jgi:1-aminocyclopropane-1-carboxylate deaminase
VKSNYPKLADTPIQDWKAIGGFELLIKRDDISHFGFGTKIRKFQIHADDFKKGQSYLLTGSYHSNLMASFAYLFHKLGANVTCLARTKDLNLMTANSLLVKHFSNKLVINSKNIPFELELFLNSHSEPIVFPEYAWESKTELGLQSLWRELEKIPNLTHIFLDIGSGLCYISALSYFFKRNNKIQIFGVSIGESKSNWLKSWDQNIAQLNWKEKIDIPTKREIISNIWEPSIAPRYAKINSTLKKWIEVKFLETGIPIEPIYSGKTLYTLEENLTKLRFKGKGVYIHQGGLLNWIDIFMLSQKLKTLS